MKPSRVSSGNSFAISRGLEVNTTLPPSKSPLKTPNKKTPPTEKLKYMHESPTGKRIQESFAKYVHHEEEWCNAAIRLERNDIEVSTPRIHTMSPEETAVSTPVYNSPTLSVVSNFTNESGKSSPMRFTEYVSEFQNEDVNLSLLFSPAEESSPKVFTLPKSA